MGRRHNQLRRIRARNRQLARGWLLALPALVALLTLLQLSDATAHPLGNFTINHYAEIDIAGRTVHLIYAVDIAEIPTYDEIKIIDTNGDRVIDQTEKDRYLPKRVEQLKSGIHLTHDGEDLPLSTASSSMDLKLGQAGLRVLRIDAEFTATLPASNSPLDLHFKDDNFAGHIGWREIVANASNGARIDSTEALSNSKSDALHTYPPNAKTDPLDMESANIRVQPGTYVDSSAAAPVSSRAGSGTPIGGLAAWPSSLVSIDNLSPWVMVITMLAALLWGAAHALTPGHGKTVVAAYLVGSRGTPRHAVLLGLTVTATHTVGVFALGGITLYLSRFILPEHLYPWMDLLSGLLVVGIGIGLAYRRWAENRARKPALSAADGSLEVRDADGLSAEERHALAHVHGIAHRRGHNHDHGSDHNSSRKLSMRGLFALGVSGGIVPCPSALVLLLSAISLGRLGYGMILVLIFSVGLAIVLTSIGLLSLYARRMFQRFSFEPRLPRMLPVLSALAVTLGGMIIVVGALQQAGFV